MPKDNAPVGDNSLSIMQLYRAQKKYCTLVILYLYIILFHPYFNVRISSFCYHTLVVIYATSGAAYYYGSISWQPIETNTCSYTINNYIHTNRFAW